MDDGVGGGLAAGTQEEFQEAQRKATAPGREPRSRLMTPSVTGKQPRTSSQRPVYGAGGLHNIRRNTELTIEKFMTDAAEAVVVNGFTVHLRKGLALETPKAAGYLADIPADQRVIALEELLDQGAVAISMVRTSAHVALLEKRVEELSASFGQGAIEQVEAAGANQAKVIAKILDDHRVALDKVLAPMTDPNAKNGLPTKMVELLEEGHRKALKQLLAVLEDGDQSALGKAVKAMIEQVKASEKALMQQFAAREALLTRSNLRGGRFEDVLTRRLPILTQGVGFVERTAVTTGNRAQNTGDYVVTLKDLAIKDVVRLVIEAKSCKSRMSPNAVRKELLEARLNRGALAGVLVAETADSLPNGIGFGQVSECDFFAAYGPEAGDETALSCAIYLARAAALASLPRGATAGIDLDIVEHEAGVIRGLLPQFDTLDSYQAKAGKAIQGAQTVTDDIRGAILAALRRMDDALHP